MQYNLPDNMVKMIASAGYGENRGQGEGAMMHTISSVYNRFGQREWANKSVPEVLQDGFYAVKDAASGKNSGFSDAMNGKFKSEADENEYKKWFVKTAAINRGTIEPTDTQFYFKQPEINRLVKNKGFDFSKVEEGEPFNTKVNGRSVKFRTFHYK